MSQSVCAGGACADASCSCQEGMQHARLRRNLLGPPARNVLLMLVSLVKYCCIPLCPYTPGQLLACSQAKSASGCALGHKDPCACARPRSMGGQCWGHVGGAPARVSRAGQVSRPPASKSWWGGTAVVSSKIAGGAWEAAACACALRHGGLQPGGVERGGAGCVGSQVEWLGSLGVVCQARRGRQLLLVDLGQLLAGGLAEGDIYGGLAGWYCGLACWVDALCTWWCDQVRGSVLCEEHIGSLTCSMMQRSMLEEVHGSF